MKLIFRSLFSQCMLAVAGVALKAILPVGAVRADVVFAWSEALGSHTTAAAAEPLAPHLEARAYVMTHLAMDEAIAEAARGVATNEARLAAQRAAVATAAQLAAIPAGADKSRAVKLGRAAAAVVLSKRDRDGWVELAALHPPAGPSPDRSSLAADLMLAGAPPAASPWSELKPFMLKTPKQFAATPPYTVTREGSVQVDFTLRNARIFDRVDRAAAAESMARNWAGRPFAVWNRIAQSAARRASLDLAGEARLLVVLNLALADATLSVLHWRHELGTWRPSTIDVLTPLHGVPPMSTDEVVLVDSGLGREIVRRDTQRVVLPPIPDFPSPMATLAGAAQAAIAGVLQDSSAPLVLPEADPWTAGAAGLPPRVIANVSAAGRECAFVASLDGRHSREACVAGYDLGEKIGAYVAKRARR